MNVISVVPSLTEAIAQTPGGRDALVGMTDWCTHPGDLDVPRFGGTKNPAVGRIIAAAPDVVVANVEENRPDDLDALRAAGLHVHLTDIRTVAQALEQLPAMLAACGLTDAPEWMARSRAVWEPLVADPPEPHTTCVVPIWRKPWMAVGSDTFTGDVLRLLGYRNVLDASPQRYPTFAVDDVAGVGLVVLPDEPYQFTPTDGPEAFDAPSALVSGRHLTWYGPSMAEAPDVLRDQLAQSLRTPAHTTRQI